MMLKNHFKQSRAWGLFALLCLHVTWLGLGSLGLGGLTEARAEMPQALVWGTALRAGSTRLVIGFSALPDYAIRPLIGDDKNGNTRYSLVIEAAAKKGKLEDRKLSNDPKLGLISDISAKTEPRGIAIHVGLNAPVIVRQHYIIPPANKSAANGKNKPQPEEKIWRVVVDITQTDSEKFLAMGVLPSTRPIIASETGLVEGMDGDSQTTPKQVVELKPEDEDADQNTPQSHQVVEHNAAQDGQNPNKPSGFWQIIAAPFSKEFWREAASLHWLANLFADDGALNPKNLAATVVGWYEKIVLWVQGKPIPSLSPSALTENSDNAASSTALIPIALDPGHGGADPGAVASDRNLEKNITLQYALEIKGVLESYGKYRVIMTRNDDSFLRLRERVAVARADGAILLVSLHADSWNTPDVYGAALYTLSDSATTKEAEMLAAKQNKSDLLAGVNVGASAPVVVSSLIDLAQRESNRASSDLARYLLAEMKTQIRMARKPYRAAGFAVLTAPDLPSVLIELGYLSNPMERSRITNPTLRRNLAQAIARGIDKYVTQNHLTAASIK